MSGSLRWGFQSVKCMGLGKHADRGSRRPREFWWCLNLQGVPGSGHTTYSQSKHLGEVTSEDCWETEFNKDSQTSSGQGASVYSHGVLSVGMHKIYNLLYTDTHLLFVELLQVCWKHRTSDKFIYFLTNSFCVIVIREEEKMGGTFKIVQPAASWCISLTGDNFHLEYALMRTESSIHCFTQSDGWRNFPQIMACLCPFQILLLHACPRAASASLCRTRCCHVMTRGPAPRHRNSRRACTGGRGRILETIPLQEGQH